MAQHKPNKTEGVFMVSSSSSTSGTRRVTLQILTQKMHTIRSQIQKEYKITIYSQWT
jgi:hypothetical protein